MKKIYLFLILACVPFFANAEGGCSVQVQVQNGLCFGDCSGSATAFPSGPGPYVFSWLPSSQTNQTASNLCPGTYTLVVTDANNCTSTTTFNIIEPPQLQLALSVTNESCSGCCDGSIVSTVTGGTPPYTYFWSPINQTSPVAQNLCSGTYTLCVIDMNGCMACDNATVNFSTAIAEQNANGNLSVFPVPSSDVVTVHETFVSPVSTVITITNMLGETLYTRSISDGTELNETINIAAFANGVYFIEVKTSAGNAVKRIIKE